MAILGIYDGQNASAAMVEEETGQLVAAVGEERYSKIRNHDARIEGLPGPIESVRHCLSRSREPATRIALALAEPDALRRQAVNAYLSSVRDGEVARLDCRRVQGVDMDYVDLLELPRTTQRQRLEMCLRTAMEAVVATDKVVVEHVPHHLAQRRPSSSRSRTPRRSS
jgi:carbamoyltransferase